MPPLTTPLDPADLEALIAYLKAGGAPADPDKAIREVSADPSELSLPGVLVQVGSVEFDRLGGVSLGVTLTCLAPELSVRSWPVLADLWNRVTALVDPSGPSQTVLMTLPDAPGGVPGLEIPYTLETCLPEEA